METKVKFETNIWNIFILIFEDFNMIYNLLRISSNFRNRRGVKEEPVLTTLVSGLGLSLENIVKAGGSQPSVKELKVGKMPLASSPQSRLQTSMWVVGVISTLSKEGFL